MTHCVPRGEMVVLLNDFVREDEDRADEDRREAEAEHNELVPLQPSGLGLWLRRRLEGHDAW